MFYEITMSDGETFGIWAEGWDEAIEEANLVKEVHEMEAEVANIEEVQ